MSRAVVRRVIVAAVAVVAVTVVPVRAGWSAPAVRLDEIPAAAGGVVDLAHPSSHLGVRWRGEETDQLSLRWRSDRGWSPWHPVVVAHDLGDEDAGIRLSGLLVADDAVDAQVRVDAGSPSGIEVVAIDTEHGPRRLVLRKAGDAVGAQSSAVAAPNIVTRAQWGADESMRGDDPPAFAPITRLAVHHTAGGEGPDPAATVRAIYAYHTQSNGWNDIGYNFLLDSHGRVYEGRYAREYASGEVHTGESLEGDGVIGAHISGNNAGTVGVALLGEFTNADPTAAAIDGLQRVLAWKADRHDIDALGTTDWTSGERPTIIGHRDAGATACPGDRMYDRLPAIRQRVAEMVGMVPPKAVTSGYWVAGKDTRLFAFGDAPYLGGPGEVPAPLSSFASTPTGNGYWLLSTSGRVRAFGDARFFGSTEHLRLNAPVVRLEPTRTGQGYWIQAADGGIFSFGDAQFFGSTGNMQLNSPVISMSATPSGRGYWLLAADGGVFTFGDGRFFGSTGSMKLNAPVVSMAPHPNGRGYWLQASDGGIFSFGAVRFHGSVPGLGLSGTAKTVQIRATPTGNGYYVLGADGGIFTFGDSKFHGAEPGLGGGSAAVDLALKTKPAA